MVAATAAIAETDLNLSLKRRLPFGRRFPLCTEAC
jgi:hypothetical protein